MFASILVLLKHELLSDSSLLTKKQAIMQRTVDLEQISGCAPGCSYGHCKLITEAWFTRTLSLERRRTERSRTSFILVLMSIEDLGDLNGDQARFIHKLVACLASITRETDILGWYRDGLVLGTIFTELGGCKHLVVNSIKAKIANALEREFGHETSNGIKISCHIFPEDGSDHKPTGQWDARLYPEIQAEKYAGWPIVPARE